ncbi:MAG: ABC transporter substrate-binding protein [Trueperaceae bacterium]|nr:MAG: ABC transporter substrate-binding protein [Trueperaceae bacterium]
MRPRSESGRGARISHAVGILLLLFLTPPTIAQTTIEFWHSHSPVEETIDALAEAFNESQGDYRVIPRYIGNYREGAIKLIAALGADNQPVLFDAEVTVFPRLVEEGTLLDLSDLAAGLAPEMVSDFFPALWQYGELQGGRYGLPWDMAVPVLFYNATAFRQLGIEVPKDWDAFEAAAARLTTRQTTGFIDVTAAFLFEMMVMSRGGQIVTDDGMPNFDSPEAIESLELLMRLADERHSLVRSFGELEAALVDFVRTKGMMAFASIGFWPQGQRYTIAFEAGAAPIPNSGDATVPLVEGQLVVVKGASEEERQGAFAFWRFLMEPEHIKTWVEASFYLPPRRSAVPLLEPWYAEDPNRRAGLDQIEHAAPRPRIGAYAIWQGYLEEAIELSLKRGVAAEVALREAQQRAESEVR